MLFDLQNDLDQRKKSQAALGLPLIVFLIGLILTATLANTFHQSEFRFKHENLETIIREFYKGQNLLLNNSILRIQSSNEISSLIHSNDSRKKNIVKEIVSNTMFQKVTLYTLHRKNKKISQDLPELDKLREINTKVVPFPENLTEKTPNIYLKRKIKKMISDNLINTIGLSSTPQMSSIYLIWRASNKKDFIVFSSPLETFFKDWPRSTGLVAVVHDRQTELDVLVEKDPFTETFNFSFNAERISSAQKKSKFVMSNNSFVDESYGVSVDWFQNSKNLTSSYVMMIIIFGLSISIMAALLLRFILDQNRRISKLVVSRTADLELAVKEAQAANTAKTLFLANVSHDLRTPLNIILGMIDLVKVDGTDKKNQNYLQTMQTAGEQLLNLINNLLSVIKEQHSDLQSIKNEDAAEPTPVHQLPLSPISILAVDDDSGNRELLKAYLDSPHFDVTFAEDGAAAFKLFIEKKPDIIIADLRMPQMSGFELAQAIHDYETIEKKSLKITPFIILTADALESTSEEAKKYSVSLFLTKPIRKNKLLQAVYSLYKQTI